MTALVVAGRGTPENAIAASLNVTVADARAAGFVTVFPCGSDRVDGSNLNYDPVSTVANAVQASPRSALIPNCASSPTRRCN